MSRSSLESSLQSICLQRRFIHQRGKDAPSTPLILTLKDCCTTKSSVSTSMDCFSCLGATTTSPGLPSVRVLHSYWLSLFSGVADSFQIFSMLGTIEASGERPHRYTVSSRNFCIPLQRDPKVQWDPGVLFQNQTSHSGGVWVHGCSPCGLLV